MFSASSLSNSGSSPAEKWTSPRTLQFSCVASGISLTLYVRLGKIELVTILGKMAIP
jgi:hypothetical protein